jgi:pyrroline-5-carboxylate reductase
MGAAMFAGWSAAGLAPSVLVDPSLPEGIARPEDRLFASVAAMPDEFAPEAVILAVKPQMAATALPALRAKLKPGTVVLSILAGKTVDGLAALLGTANPIVRAMPNTPAAIRQGMTVAFAGPGTTEDQRGLCQTLLSTIGDFAWLESEALIDPISAISGSGPAYVFLLAELLEQMAIEHGVAAPLARQLARKTIAGSGALLGASSEDSAALRTAVTSPKGTTEAALRHLMAEGAWPATLRAAIQAATARARELNALYI